MDFRIADTFTASLARLTNEEQKTVKTTAFDLQLNPANPGHQFHKLDKARDARFWSVRVNRDIRLIVHRTEGGLLLCYVDHHDAAYQWAERRKLEVHPRTGAAQLVEMVETVREIVVPKYVGVATSAPPKPALFADTTDEELLGYGVPRDWLGEVRTANEDSLLALAEHLPAEAAEALLELATGGTPAAPEPRMIGKGVWRTDSMVDVEPTADEHVDIRFQEIDIPPQFSEEPQPFAFNHPDAERRFRLIEGAEELERALDYPWDKWTIFLHPAQRELVERDYSGPARVSGSAGTGKTIVALHRAVSLARKHPTARVLLTTFSGSLANVLRTRLRSLIGNEPHLGERIEVYAIDEVGRRLYTPIFGEPRFASRADVQRLLAEVASGVPEHKFSPQFLLGEWEQVVDAWQLDSWDAYRDVKRLGRKTRLPESQRITLWKVFDSVRHQLRERGLMTQAEMFHRLAAQLPERKNPPFDFAVVDEAQDVGVAQLRFLAALGANRDNALFFTGDLGQRIFQQPFSWAALGVDIRGRSRTLHINYRTSHQIRMQADQLLGPELQDVDGNIEERRGTISVFNGPPPMVRTFETQEEEIKAVGAWLAERRDREVRPEEIGVFVRTEAELDRARAAVAAAQMKSKALDMGTETTIGHVSIGTMHLAKGLEFRAVAVMACDDEVIPHQQRIESVADESDLEEVYNTERHLLYVACTRARDELLVTGTAPASEFLSDFPSPGA